jgi:hypothetical protein
VQKRVSVPVDFTGLRLDMSDLKDLIQQIEFEFPVPEPRFFTLRARYGETTVRTESVDEFFASPGDMPDRLDSVTIYRGDAPRQKKRLTTPVPSVPIENSHARSDEEDEGAASILVLLSRDGAHAHVTSTDAGWAKNKAAAIKGSLRTKQPWYGYFRLRTIVQVLHALALFVLLVAILRYALRLTLGTFPAGEIYLAIGALALFVALLIVSLCSCYYRYLPVTDLIVRDVNHPFSASRIIGGIRNVLAVVGLVNLIFAVYDKVRH